MNRQRGVAWCKSEPRANIQEKNCPSISVLPVIFKKTNMFNLLTTLPLYVWSRARFTKTRAKKRDLMAFPLYWVFFFVILETQNLNVKTFNEH